MEFIAAVLAMDIVEHSDATFDINRVIFATEMPMWPHVVDCPRVVAVLSRSTDLDRGKLVGAQVLITGPGNTQVRLMGAILRISDEDPAGSLIVHQVPLINLTLPWPGEYRVQVFLGNEQVATLPLTVLSPAANSER